MIEQLRARRPDALISVDTTRAQVARRAIEAGANLVNDTSALHDDLDMAAAVAQSGAAVVLMHRRGMPLDMQRGGGPAYHDLIGEIVSFLAERIEFAVGCGIAPERIAIDPGIGFGKKSRDNQLILRQTDRFCALGRPVLIGASRKAFIGDVLSLPLPQDRVVGSVACGLYAAIQGASIIRVHDVGQTVQALNMLGAITGDSLETRLD